MTTTVSIGAPAGRLADRHLRGRAAKAGVPFETFAEIPRRRGVRIDSALIVAADNQTPLALVGDSFAPIAEWLGGIAFLLACADIYRRVARGG